MASELLSVAAIRMRILVLAPDPADAEWIVRQLASAGMVVERCAGLSELTASIPEGAGAVIIAQRAFSGGLGVLAAMIETQPSWSDLPVILLPEPGGQGDWSAALCEAVIVPRPWHSDCLVSVARMALRSRVRQYQLQAHLAAQQRRAMELLEESYDGYLAMDCQWRCVYVNQRGAGLLDIRREDLVGANMLDVMPHWAEGGFQARVQHVMETGQPFSTEEWCPLSERWFDVRCGRAVDGLSFFFADITARKRAEAHLCLVNDELSHRVKNTLAVVQSIAEQTFKSGVDFGSSLAAFQGRLMTLADTHTLLTDARWESVNLSALVDLSVGHLNEGARVDAAGEIIRLNPRSALAIGMTFHELSTNAAKYGALAVDGGWVEVRWRVEADELIIEWSERGGRAIGPPARKGFGSRMIDQAIGYELGGEVLRDFRRDGFYCLLTVPLEAVLAGPATQANSSTTLSSSSA